MIQENDEEIVELVPERQMPTKIQKRKVCNVSHLSLLIYLTLHLSKYG